VSRVADVIAELENAGALGGARAAFRAESSSTLSAVPIQAPCDEASLTAQQVLVEAALSKLEVLMLELQELRSVFRQMNEAFAAQRGGV
jgi:hypothetical protein